MNKNIIKHMNSSTNTLKWVRNQPAQVSSEIVLTGTTGTGGTTGVVVGAVIFEAGIRLWLGRPGLWQVLDWHP